MYTHIYIYIHIHMYIYIYICINKQTNKLPPDPFLGSWNVASLFPVACSCWLVTAAL